MVKVADNTFFADLPEEAVKEATKAPPPWDEGRYTGEITEVLDREAQEEGKFNHVMLTVAVRNGERTKNMRYYTLFESTAPWAVKGAVNFLQSVGLDRRSYRNSQQLVGLTGPVQVGIRTAPDGNQYNEIKWFINRG